MIVVDVEASGVEYHKHSIVSVGALEFENPKNRIYMECRIWEGAHVMAEALLVCGFSEEEIKDKNKKTEAELIKDFLEWSETCKEKTFVGQNVSFDRDFLKAAAERAHLDWTVAYKTIDTHTLAFMHFVQNGVELPKKNNHSDLGLDKILNYVGIPEEPTPHNAMTGALCHAEVTSRLLYNKKLLPDFDQYDIPWQKA